MTKKKIGKTNDKKELFSKESEKLKADLDKLVSGDQQSIDQINKQLEPVLQMVKKLTPSPSNEITGGVTTFKIHWWGHQIFISHDTLSKFSDINALTKQLASLGEVGLIISASAGITMGVLKTLDRGNGVILTRVLHVIGPAIPTPQ